MYQAIRDLIYIGNKGLDVCYRCNEGLDMSVNKVIDM